MALLRVVRCDFPDCKGELWFPGDGGPLPKGWACLVPFTADCGLNPARYFYCPVHREFLGLGED